MGACRANEMYLMKTEDVKDLGSAFLVTVPKTKTKVPRKFMITDKFYTICKNYLQTRPANSQSNIFFLRYHNGKCTSQRIGINKFTAMGREIANFLRLPNPEKYSGHSFRRSSATLLVDAGGDITALKRHGGWKSTTVAESYIDESMNNKLNTADKLTNSLKSDTESIFSKQIFENIQSSSNNFDIKSLPSMKFENCSGFNVTINVNK